ncbi:DsrE/DsrF/DrsH-like family protein [Roseiconus lacunae]|uniref:DsrE/DsrF/DrsH-like family protein n=2 Tax=Roseiconus lacunae TaxID=2605694 RepID=A0ABT7PDX9_9BACT|nr:DsrE/DsrF/DrsH-like family protein [Roseiconus lacunae]MDM4014702.1 DsrE/DsrF/DrsH-like family protein [Roseiconus lacunae]
MTVHSPPSNNSVSEMNKSVEDQVARLEERIDQLEKTLAEPVGADPNALNLLVFDSGKDKLLAAFVMATGAAACGMKVSMFFTFWATAALRKGGSQASQKSMVEKAFGWMLPNSIHRTKLSKMDFCGLGRAMMAQEMKRKNIADLDQLIETAADLGVTIKVCEMSMQLMGLRREELIDYPGLDYCGVAKFTEQAALSNTTLFI